MELKLLCPAKVNLFLKVLRKRDDGYHELSTLMHKIGLFDTVTVTVSEGSGISVDAGGADIPQDSSNIAFKAAALFLKAAAVDKKVAIKIEKSIPVGAGLAGGSTDAVGVLKALNVLHGRPLDEKALKNIALECGSDVPFFLIDSSAAIGTGRGEVLTDVRVDAGIWYVLQNPGFQVSTAKVYGNLALTKNAEDNILNSLKDRAFDTKAVLAFMQNDLERVTLSMHPEIAEMKRLLKEAGALASMMSGSGPTVFGVFFDYASAKKAYEQLSGTLKAPMRVFLARGL